MKQLITEWVHFCVPYPNDNYVVVGYVVSNPVAVNFISPEATVIFFALFVRRMVFRV
jgi:hypothetical protein